MVTYVEKPRPGVIQAWLWLAAEAHDLEDKHRCLNEILQLNPENQLEWKALLALDQKKPTTQDTSHSP